MGLGVYVCGCLLCWNPELFYQDIELRAGIIILNYETSEVNAGRIEIDSILETLVDTINKPIDAFNHCIDASRYAITSQLEKPNKGKYFVR